MNEMRSGLKNLLCYSLATPKYDCVVETRLLGFPRMEKLFVGSYCKTIIYEYTDHQDFLLKEKHISTYGEETDTQLNIYEPELTKSISDTICNGVLVERCIRLRRRSHKFD